MDPSIKELQFIHDIAILKLIPGELSPIFVFTLNDDLSSIRVSSRLLKYVEIEKNKNKSIPGETPFSLNMQSASMVPSNDSMVNNNKVCPQHEVIKTESTIYNINSRLNTESSITRALEPALNQCNIPIKSDSSRITLNKINLNNPETYMDEKKMHLQELSSQRHLELEIIDLGPLGSMFKFLGLYSYAMPIQNYYVIVVLKTYKKSANSKMFDKNIASLFYAILKKIDGYDFDSISTYGQICYSNYSLTHVQPKYPILNSPKTNTSHTKTSHTEIVKQQPNDISYKVTCHNTKKEEAIRIQLKDLIAQIKSVSVLWEKELFLLKTSKTGQIDENSVSRTKQIFVNVRFGIYKFYKKFELQLWILFFFSLLVALCCIYHIYLYNRSSLIIHFS